MAPTRADYQSATSVSARRHRRTTIYRQASAIGVRRLPLELRKVTRAPGQPSSPPCHVFFHNLPAADGARPNRSVANSQATTRTKSSAPRCRLLVHGHFRALLRDKSQGLDHDVVDADPVAACVQEIMATRSAWTGSGTDLLRAAAGLTGDGSPRGTPAGPNIHARAGRLRRARTVLRAVRIDIACSREGRAGNRVIRMRATRENTVDTVSSGREGGSRSAAGQPASQPSSSPISTMDPV